MKNLYCIYAKAFKEQTVIIPPSVEIDLTNHCNQNCYYCNFSENRKHATDIATANDYYSLIDKLSLWGRNSSNAVGAVNTITFVGGGEPTLFKDFGDIIQYAIEKKFMASLVTNGTGLDKLPEDTARRLSWIGIDMDAGTDYLYNVIRRPNHSNDFANVCANAKRLSGNGVNIDYKVLLLKENNSKDAIEEIFINASAVGARMIYFRLGIVNGTCVPVNTDDLNLELFSQKYHIPYRVNLTRAYSKNYHFCYSMFLLPVFAATGSVYLCCENRGEEAYRLCDWINEDFQVLWCSEKHRNLVKKIDVTKCKPCRPNIHNINIQAILSKDEALEQLFF